MFIYASAKNSIFSKVAILYSPGMRGAALAHGSYIPIWIHSSWNFSSKVVPRPIFEFA